MTGETWIECGEGFIEADVIRYWEGVWNKLGPRGRTRSVRVGDREVVAEVLREEDGWIWLLVVRSAGDQALKKDARVKRKRETIARGTGGVWRLRWSDESARAQLAQEQARRNPRAVSQASRRKRDEARDS